MRSITKKEFKAIVSKMETETRKQLEEANDIVVSADGTIQDSTSCNQSDDSLDRIYTIGYEYFEKNRKEDFDVEKIRGTFEERNLGQSYLKPNVDIITAEIYRKEIEQLHTELQDYIQKSLIVAIRIGELLFQQKQIMVHGRFTHWAKKHLPFSLRTAQNYMKLYSYKEELAQKNITTISDAYAAIAGEPAPDEVLDVDDSVKPKSFSAFVKDIELDEFQLPKKINKGVEGKIALNIDTLEEMKKDKGYFSSYKGKFTKMIIRMPYTISDPSLYGMFLQAAVPLMKPGGKIIFYRE